LKNQYIDTLTFYVEIDTIGTIHTSIKGSSMKKMSFVGVCLLLVVGIGCADTNDGRIESAKFALDRCNPSDAATVANCTAAITAAEAVIASKPSLLIGYTLASGGYFGRAGLSLSDLTETLADLSDTTDRDDYVVISDAARIAASKLGDLQSAESTLSGSPATFNDAAEFKLGMIQMVESFVLPISRVQTNDVVDVTLLTADDRTRAEADFLSADDNLIAAGLATDSELVDAVRENFCRLKAQTVGDVAGQAFSLAQHQDQLGCALDSTYVPSQDYNADGAVNRTDCTSFDPDNALVTACKTSDTAI
jgi:hypothetical protein